MKAILSGQAGTAVCFEDNRFFSVTLDSEEPLWVELKKWDVSYLFADYNDIIETEYASRSEVLEKLEIAWKQDRGLQLTLIALDSEEHQETRIEAIECLNNLVNRLEVIEYIENRLYSAPMPNNADLEGAISLSNRMLLNKTKDFFLNILNEQDEILKRYNAWNDLPDNIFDDTVGSKQDFFYEAIRYGAFRLFVKKRQKKGLALLDLITHSHFKGFNTAVKIFQKWDAPFKESNKIEFEKPEIEYDNYNNAGQVIHKKHMSADDALERVEKQKEKIKTLLLSGDADTAFKYASSLIEIQKIISKPKHIAMSLCDLAQFSKDSIGNPELQAKFAEMAVLEVPNDSRSHSTLGDAYRLLAKYNESIDMYHEAGVKAKTAENIIVALNGHAEVLKDLGRIEEAMNIYEQCINEYGDYVSKNAMAAALAHHGRLEEALLIYNKILDENLLDENMVTHCGRAMVLNAIGRENEALEEIENISYKGDGDILKLNAYLLRESGKLEEAEKILSDLIKQNYSIYETKASHARILADLGKFEEAIQENNDNITNSCLSPWSYISNAEIYRKMGELTKALDAYNLFIDKFPYNGFYKNGKASVLVGLGRYQEALTILNEREKPASKTEWVAYHIRGMAYLRKGELTEAEKIFEWGLKECSWVSQREYFKTALASLRIRQEKYLEAISLVEEINNPRIKPVAIVLVMHASAELSDKNLLMKSYEAIPISGISDNIIKLRDVIINKYKKNNKYANEEIYTKECDMILYDAAA
ncbi:MAG: tetratricopeptide repeat protein [bacterium]|jgi:tetratricopeptide (TPR) repeat protein